MVAILDGGGNYVPAITRSGPTSAAAPNQNILIPATNTATPLGPSTQRFYGINFYGDHGLGSNNTSAVTIQIQNGSGGWVNWKSLAAGATASYLSPGGSKEFLVASDFQVVTTSAGDGIRYDFDQQV